jgi:DNA-binding NarL/FixJ family response regulator
VKSGPAASLLRAVIVDDEPLAREGIRVRLLRAGGVAIVGECEDGDQAVTLIRHTKPDVAFLDIQMPGRTGIEVIKALGPADCPRFVFITAYDVQHVLRGDQSAHKMHPAQMAARQRADEQVAVPFRNACAV